MKAPEFKASRKGIKNKYPVKAKKATGKSSALSSMGSAITRKMLGMK